MKKLTLLFIFLTGLAFFSYAQNPQWVQYLNSDNITCLAETDNSIWAGAWEGGLIQIDKSTGFTTFYNELNSGLPGNSVTAVCTDENDLVWIGTRFSGVASFDGENWTTYNESNSGLSLNCIASLAVEESGTLWVGTGCISNYGIWGHGLSVFDGTNWTSYLDTCNLYIYSIAIDSDNKKWIGAGPECPQYVTCGGLYTFDGINWEYYNESNSGLPISMISAIAIGEGGTMWGCSAGLVSFDGTNWEHFTTSNSGLPDNHINAIAIEEDGTKWIGTWGGGLAAFDETNWEVFNASNSGLPVDYIKSVLIDIDGTKWIGIKSDVYYGLTDGLVTFDGTTWVNYETSNSGLTNNHVNAIAFEGDETKWIGTWGGGVVSYDGTYWETFDESNSGLPDNYINAIAIEEDGTKWLATSGGLASFDGNNWQNYLSDQDLSSIAIDQDGTKWVGAWGTYLGGYGLYAYDGQNWTHYSTSNSELPSNNISSIAIDNDGTKWIATQPNYSSGNGGGLASFDGSNWVVYDTSSSTLPSNWINSVAIDNSGTKWIVTYCYTGSPGSYWFYDGNLISFDSTDWIVYNTANSPLPDPFIACLSIDANNTKWMGVWMWYEEYPLAHGLIGFNESGIPLEVEEQNTLCDNVIIYPNPVESITMIKYSLKNPSMVRVEIFDVSGKVVANLFTGYQHHGEQNLIFKTARLKPGVYLCSIKTNEGMQTKKIIKTK